MSGKLTTHILDIAKGRPAAGMALTLERLDESGGAMRIGHWISNADGRCDAPLLQGAELTEGSYQLCFLAGDYFREHPDTRDLAEPRFVDVVVLRFGIADANAHYHVPLLVSPWSYSTYRGS